DEQRRREDGSELVDGVRHCFLNIFSMRSVMRNPLTMLVMEANSAMAPRIRMVFGYSAPVTAMDPTTAIAEIALVSDMSGVYSRRLETFFAYIWLACTGTVLGRLTGPRISTPCRRTSVPASASSQFPPVSTARSTITEPGFMPRTASAVIRIGARFPGMAAVV